LLKRLFDIVASFLGLIILSPILLSIAILIKLMMPGPILFIQNRIGRKYKEFKILKFRTMIIIPQRSEEIFEAGDLTRITQFGRFLRRTKMDEIPQLINVLKGEMTIVGPRPEVKSWTEIYPEKWDIVLSVYPGITDNASVEFRNEEELLSKAENPDKTYREVILPQKLDFYIDYVKNHTFRGDLVIIFRTIKAILLK
jgi:lipopolysaccharide/colanic/teichoic acid biosynthesis glycosyltransferase